MDNQNELTKEEKVVVESKPAEVKPKVYLPDVQDPAEANICESCQ